jgi:hypothetical protein
VIGRAAGVTGVTAIRRSFDGVIERNQGQENALTGSRPRAQRSFGRRRWGSLPDQPQARFARFTARREFASKP